MATAQAQTDANDLPQSPSQQGTTAVAKKPDGLPLMTPTLPTPTPMPVAPKPTVTPAASPAPQQGFLAGGMPTASPAPLQNTSGWLAGGTPAPAGPTPVAGGQQPIPQGTGLPVAIPQGGVLPTDPEQPATPAGGPVNKTHNGAPIPTGIPLTNPAASAANTTTMDWSKFNQPGTKHEMRGLTAEEARARGTSTDGNNVPQGDFMIAPDGTQVDYNDWAAATGNNVAKGAGGAPLIGPAGGGGGGYADLVGSGTAAGDYLGKTIQPGQGVDRVKLAQSNFDTFAKASDPYYQKALHDATSQAAGAGRLGSGMLRTGLGDLAHQRGLELDTQKQSLIDDATKGSIDDMYKNIGIAQQQQGFQAGQQNTRFSQAMQEQQLQEALRNGDYSRAMGILNAGEQGNPSGTALSLSNNYGNQASAAGAGAAGLVSNAVNANASRRSSDQMAQLIAQLRGGGAVGGSGNDGLWEQLINSIGLNGVGDIQNAGQGGVHVTPGQPGIPIGLPSGPIYQPSYPAGYK